MMQQAEFVYRTQQDGVPCRPGGLIEIRPGGPADADAIRSFITGLSPRTQYLRFFAGVAPPGSALLRGLTGTGNGADIVVATCRSPACGEPACGEPASGEQIVGHAMAADGTDPDGTRTVNIGLVVADGSQRRGVGSALMRLLLARAFARGARIAVMDVLPGNARVLAMIAGHWPGARRERTGDSVLVRASLTAPSLMPGPATARAPALVRAPAAAQSSAVVHAPAVVRRPAAALAGKA